MARRQRGALLFELRERRQRDIELANGTQRARDASNLATRLLDLAVATAHEDWERFANPSRRDAHLVQRFVVAVEQSGPRLEQRT